MLLCEKTVGRTSVARRAQGDRMKHVPVVSQETTSPYRSKLRRRKASFAAKGLQGDVVMGDGGRVG